MKGENSIAEQERVTANPEDRFPELTVGSIGKVVKSVDTVADTIEPAAAGHNLHLLIPECSHALSLGVETAASTLGVWTVQQGIGQ